MLKDLYTVNKEHLDSASRGQISAEVGPTVVSTLPAPADEDSLEENSTDTTMGIAAKAAVESTVSTVANNASVALKGLNEMSSKHPNHNAAYNLGTSLLETVGLGFGILVIYFIVILVLKKLNLIGSFKSSDIEMEPLNVEQLPEQLNDENVAESVV